MTLQLQVAMTSRRGGRAHNEDASGHWHCDERLCCVVADGAGGHGGGDKASKLAVESILGRFAAAPAVSPSLLAEMIAGTNRTIIRHRGDAAAVQNMYSTVVALTVDRTRSAAFWGHTGDSRLYAFRTGRIAARTRDHSLVQSLVDGGMLAPEDALSHPQRSELLSALGVDEGDLQIAVSQEAWTLQPGDVFLLCTDGVWEYVDDAALEASLAQVADPLGWLHALEGRVLEAAAKKPRHDNFTALAVWVR